MKSIFYIINSHFWKSMTGPFFAFLFPIILIMILGTLLGYDQILGGLLSIPIVTIALTILPIALFEFKSSSLLKRIGVTSIKPWMFLGAITSYYSIVMIVSVIISVLFSLIMFSNFWNQGRLIWDKASWKIYAPSFSAVLKHVNWGGFIYANIISIIVCSSLGLLISSVCKSSLSIQGINIPILILSVFLSAQVLPIAMIKNTNALYYVSYLSPFKYSTGLIIESWQGNIDIENIPKTAQTINIGYKGIQNIFNVKQPFNSYFDMFGASSDNEIIFNMGDKIANLVMPFIFTLLFGSISLRKFRWSNR